MTLNEFIESNVTRNQWFYFNDIQIYLRKSKRLINSELLDFLDIASVEVSANKQRKGIFTYFLENLLQTYPDKNILVESILNPVLLPFLERYGFKKYNEMENMYLIRK